ncbi:MAG: hypothetical protein K0S95_621 [Pantoea eucrina]|jgi:RNA polymerase-binding transcription factor DksA|nr:hypothetical protein [Pantoea eucrina]
MADSMDIVQQRPREMLTRNVALIVDHAPAIRALFCENRKAPIPELHCRACPGVTHCLSCQEIEE